MAKKYKMLKVDELLFLILKDVPLPDKNWSSKARSILEQTCNILYPDVVIKTTESYDLGKKIAKENPIAAEVVKNCD